MTIAQQIKWDFKANEILEIRDKNGKPIYIEHSNGYWEKKEYDSQGNIIYLEDSTGFWTKREYDSQCNIIYLEDSTGFWAKWEWDSQGNVIYFENSNGGIRDNRPKLCESKEIVIEGVKYRLTKL